MTLQFYKVFATVPKTTGIGHINRKTGVNEWHVHYVVGFPSQVLRHCELRDDHYWHEDRLAGYSFTARTVGHDERALLNEDELDVSMLCTTTEYAAAYPEPELEMA